MSVTLLRLVNVLLLHMVTHYSTNTYSTTFPDHFQIPQLFQVIQGRVKLLSKRVWFSCLLQQNIMWHLPEWSAKHIKCLKSSPEQFAGVPRECTCLQDGGWSRQWSAKRIFYFVNLHNMSINSLHLCLRLLCRLLHCCKPLSMQQDHEALTFT